MAADELSDKVEAGTATAADALGVLPLGKMAKIAGASSTESKLLEAAQVLDTVNDSTEQSSKSTENDIAEVIEQ